MGPAMKIFRSENKKGIALVYIAILIVALIGLLGLAIDIGYLYVAKGQLQNAADASALAGAARIKFPVTGPAAFQQYSARSAAQTFALKNYAAREPVVVASDPTSNTLSDITVTGGNDITFGHWSSNRYHEGLTPVNAIRVRTRRTVPDATADNQGQVSTFFGRIFSLLPGGGVGFPFMSPAAEAIAITPPPPILGTPLCIITCGFVTPLTVDSTQRNVTPGTRFFVKKQDGTPNIGWTSFFDKNTSGPTIAGYINNPASIPPNLCSNCINTTEGIVNPAFCDLLVKFRAESANYTVNGVSIRGYKVRIPILSSLQECSGSHAGCFTDPGYQPGDPFKVVGFTEAIITDVIPQGNCPGVPNQTDPTPPGPGIVLVGTGPAAAGNPNTSTLCCIACPGESVPSSCSPPLIGGPPRLVH